MQRLKEKTLSTKDIIKKLGNAVAVIAMGFVIARIWKYKQQITDVWSGRVTLVMLLTMAICGFLVIGMGYCFMLLTRAVTGKDLRTSLVVPLYVKSNLYKYLPGNIMHYVGRNQIAVESDATHTEIILCTLTEMALSCAGGLLAGAIFSFSYVKEWLDGKGIVRPAVIAIICMAVAAALAMLTIASKKPALKEKLMQMFRRRNLIVLFLFLAYVVFNQTLQGLLFYRLLCAMGSVFPAGQTLGIAGIYAFSWLVGFVTPGAPGGLGVREAMLSLFLAGAVDPGLIATAAVLNRIITTCGDVLAFAVTALFTKIRKSREC